MIGRGLPVLGAFGGPFQAFEVAEFPDHPFGQRVDVGAGEQQAAGLQDAVEFLDIFGADDAAFMMAVFRPWIGVEDVDALD